jgi:hypothetical protein
MSVQKAVEASAIPYFPIVTILMKQYTKLKFPNIEVTNPTVNALNIYMALFCKKYRPGKPVFLGPLGYLFLLPFFKTRTD